MSTVTNAIAWVLGFFMRGFYNFTGSYGVSIILFTLLTKVILFPVNIFIQKNSIRMVKLQPELNAMKIKYIDDKDKYADAQLAVYKKYKYHPMLGVVPMIFQLVLVMGVLGVVYNPLTHILQIGTGEIDTLLKWLSDVMGVTDAGSYSQIRIIEFLSGGAAAPEGLSADSLRKISELNMTFLGFDLGKIPSLKNGISDALIPVLAGISAYILCFAQNKINILQLSASTANRIGTTIFMVAFSLYFAFLVPQGVGLYWICGNLFVIPFMLLVNLLIPPKKYIDLGYLHRMQEEVAQKEQKYRRYHKIEKADYKRFCNENGKHIFFYVESKGFYKYFKDIIKYIFVYSDYDIHYVTSDPEDPILSDPRERLHTYYVSRDKYLIPLFMKLDCELAMLTTPDLEKYHLKRSRVRKDIEYVYMNHGIESVALTLRKGALDWYDTVFCPRKEIVNEIRLLEEKYHTPKKLLVETGYPLFDQMTEEYEAMDHKKNDPPQIIIAPSWQPDNIIDLCGEELIDRLAGSGYRVIVRPHPQHVRHDPAKFESMKEKYADNSNIDIQTDFTLNSPVLESDLLITDWSGIGCEFAFVTKKPVLYINTPMKIMNPDFDETFKVDGSADLRSLLGENIDPDKLEGVNELINKMFANYDEYSKRIDKTYHEVIFGIGKSAQLGAKYIVRSVDKKLGKR